MRDQKKSQAKSSRVEATERKEKGVRHVFSETVLLSQGGSWELVT